MSWTALYDWWRGKNEAPMPGAMAPKTEPALRQEQFAPVKQTNRLEIQLNVVNAVKKGEMPTAEDLETLGIRVYEKTKRDFVIKGQADMDAAVRRRTEAADFVLNIGQPLDPKVWRGGVPTRTRQFEVVLFAPESGLDDMVTPLYDRDPVSIDEYVRAVGFAAQNRVAGSTHKVTLVYS